MAERVSYTGNVRCVGGGRDLVAAVTTLGLPKAQGGEARPGPAQTSVLRERIARRVAGRGNATERGALTLVRGPCRCRCVAIPQSPVPWRRLTRPCTRQVGMVVLFYCACSGGMLVINKLAVHNIAAPAFVRIEPSSSGRRPSLTYCCSLRSRCASLWRLQAACSSGGSLVHWSWIPSSGARSNTLWCTSAPSRAARGQT